MVIIPITRLQTFIVPPTGVGRTDYSQSIAQSVEPLTTDWQSDYHVYRTFNIGAGLTHTEDITIDSGFVIVPFDYYLSCYPSMDIGLRVYLFSALGNYVVVADKVGTQFIDLRLAKGIPFFNKWRIRARNYGGAPADFSFSAHGITTRETTYYGSEANVP